MLVGSCGWNAFKEKTRYVFLIVNYVKYDTTNTDNQSGSSHFSITENCYREHRHNSESYVRNPHPLPPLCEELNYIHVFIVHPESTLILLGGLLLKPCSLSVEPATCFQVYL